MHITGTDAWLAPEGRALVEQAAAWGRDALAPRAAAVDRDSTLPPATLAEWRQGPWAAMAVARELGGQGAELPTCVAVLAELGRHCGATALGLAMHLGVCLVAGSRASALGLAAGGWPAQAEAVVRQGRLFAQPFSEAGPSSTGRAPFGTRARAVDGGWRLSGRKVFVSMAGVADAYAVPCSPDRAGATPADALLLAVAADADGLRVDGEWDALGMRGTMSRTLAFDEVFVPRSALLLAEGTLAPLLARSPQMLLLQAAPYLGIAQAAFDTTVAYLRGAWPGLPPVSRRMYPTKQHAVAQMRLWLEQARALCLQAARDDAPDPDAEARLRLLAAQHTVMEHAQAVAALAVRTCGGQGVLKGLPLERLYRDARCGSAMLPWSAELCLDRLGRESLYDAGEGDESID